MHPLFQREMALFRLGKSGHWHPKYKHCKPYL